MCPGESKLVPPRPKEVTAEKALALEKAKLDRFVGTEGQTQRDGPTSHGKACSERNSACLLISNKNCLRLKWSPERHVRVAFSPTQSVAQSIEPPDHSEVDPDSDHMSQDGLGTRGDRDGPMEQSTLEG